MSLNLCGAPATAKRKNCESVVELIWPTVEGRPCRISTRPRADKWRRASRTVGLLTLKALANSVSEGSSSPGTSAPERIFSIR